MNPSISLTVGKIYQSLRFAPTSVVTLVMQKTTEQANPARL